MRFSSLGVVDADDRWRRVYEEWRSNGSCGAIGLFGNARRRRSDYVKCRENERVFLPYHADNLFGLLPKSWFSGMEQMAELRRLATKAGGEGWRRQECRCAGALNVLLLRPASDVAKPAT